MARRHPDYDFTRRREHDVDVEKQIQHLKDQLNKKDNELQLVKVHKVCPLLCLIEKKKIFRQVMKKKFVIVMQIFDN